MLIGGIEAGGTKIVCGAAEVTEEGIHILDRMRFATGRPEEAVRKAADYFKDFPIKALGVACFGPLDLRKDSATYGHIMATPKKGWEHFDLLGPFEKEIGVQTLAEGVETKEQLDFLKSIGCEKIQGYYFGKPMPYDNVVERIKEQRWVTETREMAQYYDAAGREDFLTNRPFALLEDDGTKFRYLFVNNEFMKSLATAGTTSTDMSEHTINDNASQLSHLFRNFANEIAESGKEQVLTYTSKNQYMRLRCKTIASCGNKHIHRTELINVTFNSDQRQQDMLDGLVRNIYYLYNTVFIINFDENSCNPIVASASSWEFLHQKTYGLEEVRLSYARQNIHPDDQERFLEFVRLDNMEQRIEDSPEGMIADYFRTKGADGNFTWDVHTIISIPKTNGKVFLYTSKLSPLDDGTLRKHVLKEYIKDDKPELKTAENKAE